MDLGLLLLRLVVGLTIAAHGTQKLFGWFGGRGIQGTGGWLESLGFRPGKPHAGLTGLAEAGGGVLLAFGFLTPLGAAAVVGVMIVAIVTVHWQKGFFIAEGGFEFNLVLMTAAASLAFAGAGSYSIDALIDWDLAGTEWGLAALGLGVLGALITLGARRPEHAGGAQTT